MSLIDRQPIVAPAIGEYDGYLQNYEALAVIGNDLAIAQQVVNIAANLSFPGIARSAKTTSSIATHLPIVTHISGLFRLYYTNLIASYRLYSTMQQLLDHFGDDIIITPQLIINGESIDLFIQFGEGKQRRYFAIMLRTKSRSAVYWNPSREVFIYKREKDKQTWDWKSLTKSSRTKSTIETLKLVGNLTAQRNPLVGKKNNPTAKAIVFTNETHLNRELNHDFVVDFGRTKGKVLKIKTDCVFYVLNSEDLIDFLEPPLPEPQETTEQKEVLSVCQ
jgi:hypothetical protein